MELDNFLSVAAPFGRLQVTEPSVVEDMLADTEIGFDETQRVPAWRPVAFRGKPSLSVTIKETVRAVQCERPNVETVVQLSGELRTHCQLEGHGSEVTLLLMNSADTASKGWSAVPLKGVAIHSCVLPTSELPSKDGATRASTSND